MSLHPSLSSGTKGKQHRSVLKRYERIKTLDEKGKWEDKDSIYRLPKLKIIKIKIKKEKAAEATAAAATAETKEATTTAAAAPTPTPEVKTKDTAKKEVKKEGK